MFSRLLSLQVTLRDELAAAEVTPEALCACAAAHGWQLTATTPVYHVHERPEVAVHQLLVPRRPDWTDYGQCVLRAIADLAEHEGRSPLAVWVDLVGLTEPASATAPPPAGDGSPRADRPSARPTEPLDAAQARLPGIPPGPDRRRTRHVFGGFEPRTFPVGPTAPEATVVNLVRSCKHCPCLHRVASSGARLGAEDLYSTGDNWSRASPECIAKRAKE
jgi:hypothetical protein